MYCLQVLIRSFVVCRLCELARVVTVVLVLRLFSYSHRFAWFQTEKLSFYLQEFETTLKEWEIQQEKISSSVTSVQAEVLTSLVQSLSILVNW